MEPPQVIHQALQINNVRVFFPHNPYETQVQYMTKVVEAISKSQNAMLESPTGTGKTLSLLCSSLAWLQKNGENSANKSVIYYTSRTHKQLDQAANEMKTTAYSKIPAVVLGSRAKMCIFDGVKGQAAENLVNRACRNAIAKNACSYYTNYEQKLVNMDPHKVHDIEDLVKFGQDHQCCPYYASKKLAETKASIVFMPYNYLLDISLRKSTPLKLENSVVIFDEAHNIDSALKDSVSGSFTSDCLKIVKESLRYLPEKLSRALNQELHGFSRSGYDPKNKRQKIVDEFSTDKDKKDKKEAKVNPIEELAEKLTNEKLKQVNTAVELIEKEIFNCMKKDETSDIIKVKNIMEAAGVVYATSAYIITTLESMASFYSIASIIMSPEKVAQYVSAITNLCHVISLLFPEENLSLILQKNHESRLNEFYKAHLACTYETSAFLMRGEVKSWELNVWCLHPAIGLKKIFDSSCIRGPRSLILTSGTLSPMDLLVKELETKFGILETFKHVIHKDQLKMMIVGESPNYYNLESHFKATQKPEYFLELGKTLLPLMKVLPFGTLVFFPSYSLMAKALAHWKEKSTILKDMKANNNSIYFEKKKQDEFYKDLEDFKKNAPRKAVFFAVCRGKLSEGLNLDGDQCRSVIITGLPFPSIKDPKVVATRQFYESEKGDKKEPRNSHWYSQQMRRALNQTIGRVIRSQRDFGLLILCDPRFQAYGTGLSEWAVPFFPNEMTQMCTIETEIKGFFSQHGIDINQSLSENIGCIEVDITKRKRAPAINASEHQPAKKLHTNPTKPSSLDLVGQNYRNKRDSSPPIEVSNQESPSKEPSNKTNGDPRPAMSKQSPVNNQLQTNGTGKASTKGCQKKPAEQNIFKKPAQSKSVTVNCNQNGTSMKNSSIDKIFAAASQDTVSSTQSAGNLSILNQFRRDRPTGYKCYICKNTAIDPHKTNCKCASVACFKELHPLNGTKCGECHVVFKRKEFKPLLFKSAFKASEKADMIVVPYKRGS